MDVLYNDLMAILDFAEAKVGELPEGISPENIRYIKDVVAGAALGVKKGEESA